MSVQVPTEEMNQEIRDPDRPPTEANAEDKEELLYDISEEFCGPSSMPLWPRINSRIRDFMKLNQIEQFRDQSLALQVDFCMTRGERMNCILLELERYRSELIKVALKGTRNGSHDIMRIVDSHTELHMDMKECVEEVLYDAIEDAKCCKCHLIEEFKWVQKVINRDKAEREAARRKFGKFTSFFYILFRRFPRLKKLSTKKEVVLNPDTYDGFFFKMGKEFSRNAAALDKAKELLQKQRLLITLAQDAMVWDPEHVFLHEGKIQGQLWTDGFKDEHVEKVDGDRWSVQMKWIADEGSIWRPKTIYVDGKSGRQGGERVEWVPIEPDCSNVEFDVEILTTMAIPRDDIYDDEEYNTEEEDPNPTLDDDI